MIECVRDSARCARCGVEDSDVVIAMLAWRPAIGHADESGAIREPAIDDVVSRLPRQSPRTGRRPQPDIECSAVARILRPRGGAPVAAERGRQVQKSASGGRESRARSLRTQRSAPAIPILCVHWNNTRHECAVEIEQPLQRSLAGCAQIQRGTRKSRHY